jgi:ABC-type tungstate transport system substrate-binding protein
MAVNIDRQYFLILFSEFSKIDSAVVAAYIDIASNRVPASVWGGNVQYATALMTAHMLCSRGHTGSGSAGGAITAEQVGDLSRSYETVAEKGSGDA